MVRYPSRNNYPAESIALFERAAEKVSMVADIDLIEHVDWPNFVATYSTTPSPNNPNHALTVFARLAWLYGLSSMLMFNIINGCTPMTTPHATPAFTAVVGTPQQVRNQLAHAKATQVIALPVTSDAEHAALLGQTLGNVAAFIDMRLREQDEQAFTALVNAVLPKAPPSPNLMREAVMAGRIRQAVLQGADWLTASQVAKLAGLSASNPSTQPNKWKRQRQIFAIHHNGVDYFPGYALNPDTGYRPRKCLKPILDVFADTKDGWGIAGWFLALNSFLGGRKPQDVLLTDPQAVLDAAMDEMQEIAHG